MKPLAEIDPRLREEAANTSLEHGQNSAEPKPLQNAIDWFGFLVEHSAKDDVGRSRWTVSLGEALRALGEREGGTARLEQAVAVFREALQEQTREGAPSDWAMNLNNLGNALFRLGEREGGAARLEEAVSAYCEALQENTRAACRSNGL